MREKILPEIQAGFRALRCCMDNIYALTAAIQLHLRLKGRKVYGLFVDFKRAFDSVPQEKLWSKLASFGVSPKFIRILKELYDKAALRVRVGGDLSSRIEVTEGVLQGEILSPLLFLLYLADIEKELRRAGVEGINIDGTHDLLLLLYADDLILLADTPRDLRKKLKALWDYCNSLDLTVNIGKTKIVPFKRGGRPNSEVFYYGDQEVEQVNSYVYLGVVFSSSILGGKAADQASNKCKAAIGAVLGTLARLRGDSWLGLLRLYDSIVLSTLLYASPIWGLRVAHVLEAVQLSFFKRLFQLPYCTTSSALRLELGLVKIKYKIFHLTWCWLMKLHEMEPDRIPKICFARQLKIFLDNRGTDHPVSSKYNWVAQVNDWLEEIDCTDLWNNVSYDYWLSREYEVHKHMLDFLINEDLKHYASTSSCQFLLHRPRAVDDDFALVPANYLIVNNPFIMTRVVAQLRLASSRICRIVINKISYNLDPTKICRCCNMGALETIKHFLCDCPAFQFWRDKFLDSIQFNVRPGEDFLQAILNGDNPLLFKRTFFYVSRALRERAHLGDTADAGNDIGGPTLAP